MMKKITVEKNEGVAEVIDRALAESADEILLLVPKGSALGKSARNFTLLAREVEAAGKFVFIESPDAAIMAFARAAGLHVGAKHSSAHEMSDIVSPHRGKADEAEEPPTPSPAIKHRAGGEVKRKLKVMSEDAETEEGEEAAEESEEARGQDEHDDGASEAAGTGRNFFADQQDRFFKNRTLTESGDDEDADDSDEPRGKFPWKWVGIVVVVAAVVALGAWAVAILFGHVTIAINFTETPWQYAGTFIADKSASTVNGTNGVIPAQVFSINKNTTQLFPASGEQNMSVKATGMLTIYNAYSSAPQTLVATTRFVTPDGKIFRLVGSVVVPGAAITNGQIVPSSINAPVVADAAGSDYNVGPVAKLTVPGFANTPKFAGFYGALASSTSGGFTGEKPVPTAADIAAAKASTTVILQAALGNSLAGTYPNNFMILASTTQVTKLTVNTSTDQNGKFSAFGEATLSAIGFDQAAFKTFLLGLAQTAEPSSTFSSLALQYGGITPDFVGGKVNFSVNAQGSLEPAFSSSTFDGIIEGKSIASARMAIASLPQLENGSISVWPSWLWSIPSDSKKIELNVK
jgi:hypothetical protein